ncbi:hypothetical protein [Microbulbifer taiwanensis]|uniref:Uncharacterized protein n=1 Tax=Microbulbifer taiwanensis TaxID=986746 RepID=A0ABW1YI13_9GAMM|nr:hypothetical protein [Microbulbifer taiwanensis]
MIGNRQQQTHTRELKAGTPHHIEQSCEFVFIDQGQDLDIRVGNSRLSGRRAGDFARFDKPVDVVEIMSPYDQVVKLVLGFGEFSRLIVSGELNVSQYIQTRGNGQALSMPFDLTKTVGQLSLGEQFYAAGSQIQLISSGVQPGQRASFYFRGNWYAFDGDGNGAYSLYQFNERSTGIDATHALDKTGVTFGFGGVKGAAASPSGVVVFRHYRDLYMFRVGEYAVNRVASNAFTYLSGHGGYYLDGKYYFLDSEVDAPEPNGAIVVFDLDGGTVDRIAIPYSPPSENNNMIFLRGNLLYIGNGSFYATYDPTAVQFEEYLGSVPGLQVGGVSGSGMAFNADGTIYCKGWVSGPGYTLNYIDDLTTYGEIYSQDGADIGTRKTAFLMSPVDHFPENGGHIVTGPVIEAVLRTLGDYNTDNYQDYLTAVRFNDGSVTRTVGSGTQSYSLRGINAEKLPIFLESEITLTMLPEFFDQ